MNFQYKFTIPSCYADPSVRLGTAHAMMVVQDALSCWQRAHMIGNMEIRDKGFFWVVTKSRVCFHRYPLWNEEVTVRAGFADGGRIRTELVVEIVDGQGVAVEARQEYCILDFERHRPQKLECVGFVPDCAALPPAGYERFVMEGLAPVRTVQVLPHMIDMSGHLNNVEYVKLAMDCFESDFTATHEAVLLETHHLKECKEGTELTLFRRDEGQTSFCRIAAGDTPVFEAKMIWRDRK